MRSLLVSCLLLVLTPVLNAQNYPDLSGTWYQNGNSSSPAYIIQNGQYLSFVFSNTSTTASFTSANQVYATQWKTYASISADGNTLTWSNQTWTRANLNYPNIAGTWYVKRLTHNCNPKRKEPGVHHGQWQVERDISMLTNAIYASDWNTYAAYDPNTRSSEMG
jgi:hypothetical protein